MRQIKNNQFSSWRLRFLFLLAVLFLHACGRGGHGNQLEAPPAAPAHLTATPFSGGVSVGWEEVAGATSYNVYRAISPGVTKANYETLFGEKNSVAESPFTVSDLVDGTPYFFIVTALNAAGESAESEEISATPTAAGLPNAPTGLLAHPGDQQITLEWTSVTDASSYFVYMSTVPGISRENWPTIVGGKRAQVLGGATVRIETGLTNGTPYYFVVTALNNLGQSVESSEASAIPFAAETVPTPPTNLTASAGDTELFLNWTAAGGADPASYTLYWRNTPGVTTSNGTAIPHLSGTAYIHTGLTNNTTYYYILTAGNAKGESLPSDEALATPIPSPPPVAVTLPPSNVLITGSAVLNGTVNPLDFSGQTTAYFEYGVTTGYGTVTSSQIIQAGNIFTPVFDGLAGLLPNTPYHYRIVATNSRGTSRGADQTFTLPFLSAANEFLMEEGGSPNDIVVADLNGDNIDDLAVANSGTNTVSIRLGTGNWTPPRSAFDSLISYAVGKNPQHIAAGKFHGNSHPTDLITSNNQSGTVTLLSNDGTGVFTATTTNLWVAPVNPGDPDDSLVTFPSDLVVADFNNDGIDDVAVAAAINSAGKVVILLGDGAGGFSSKNLFPAGISPTGIAAGDLDHDGNIDLFVTNLLTNRVLFLKGAGDGSFALAPPPQNPDNPDKFPVGDGTSSYRPIAIAVADFNGDKDTNGIPYLDLAVVNNASSTISIFSNDTAGSLNPPTGFSVGLQPYDVIAVKLNPANPSDPVYLVVPNFKGDSVTVYIGAGDGTFGHAFEKALGTNKNPVAVATGHFTSPPSSLPDDRKLDLVVVNRSANSVSVLLGQ